MPGVSALMKVNKYLWFKLLFLLNKLHLFPIPGSGNRTRRERIVIILAIRMKRVLYLWLLCLSTTAYAQNGNNRTISFDGTWLFTKDSVTNAEQVKFDDSKWRKVDLPHDWSIEDLPNQKPGEITGPFNKNAAGSGATGFTDGGTGWYRKRFVTRKEMHGKLISINFDGVYMNSDVWFNGHHLGNHPYGYTPFCYDLTPYFNATGKENILSVRVKNEGKNSRWYSGSGIYRHVWLTATNPVHVAPGGVYLATKAVAGNSATIVINSTVANQGALRGNISLVTTIIGPDQKAAGHIQAALNIDKDSVLTNSQIWSVEKPRLYKAVTEIQTGGKVVDHVETPFGIRIIHVDAVSGLTLNGKRVMLKGGCIHQDNGPLGSATIDRAEERKIEKLKDNGFNAIRTSHNPPSRQLLDACDRLGMLVIDEAFDMWERGKNPQDYHLYFKEWWKKDLDAMVLRDRNHPSVIFWSIGNEINERADCSGLRITKQLTDEVHRLDPTRPVTEAICQFWDHADYKWDTTAHAYALLDVGGYNYELDKYESDHQKFPDRVMMGTESYPKAALANWNMVEEHPYVLGDFVWTAVDYMGEASIGHSTLDSTRKFEFSLGWPWYNAWCGDIDLIGNKKPQSYYRDIVWRTKPIAMAVHAPVSKRLVENISPWGWPLESQSWTWPGMEGQQMEVRVFSRAPTVRLRLNGKMIGEQKLAAGSITAVFKVAYEPGTLTAENIKNDKPTGIIEFKTAGKVTHIVLKADRTHIRNGRNDLSYVMVEVVDDKNQVVPNAEIPVQFAISGAGELAAVGNANPVDLASFQGPERNTYEGKCLAIVRPTGKQGSIILKAMANGLPSTQIIISVH
jgi:beta-galactosidase